ncbi:MAG: hypothetical protein H0Z34_14700 [Brevibacillus sp.]|nr:hypothetical protein [Brevibacillus sp.]
MQLRSKSLTGAIQPLSFVDAMLRQQGFRRVGEEHAPLYDAIIYDSATSISYYLRIPTSVIPSRTGQDEQTLKIGQPYIESKPPAQGGEKDGIIPGAILRAAEYKLAEIADYLAHAASPGKKRLR